MHRNADGAGLVGDGTGDRLADPPRRVRRELEALRVVELLDRTDQPEVALLDEVEQRHPATDVALGDRHDEAQVGLGELAAGELAVALHGLHARAPAVAEGLGRRFGRRASRVASRPASMRLASVTSCSAVSSGTLPISLRYMRTGSKLPPSLCVTRADDRTAASSASAFFVRRSAGRRAASRLRARSAGARDARPRADAVRGVAALGADAPPARRWSSSCSSSAISSSTLMPRDSNMSQSSRSSSVSGSRSGNAAKISPVVMKPRSRTWSSTPTVAAVGASTRRRRSAAGASCVFGLSRLGHRHHCVRAPPTR